VGDNNLAGTPGQRDTSERCRWGETYSVVLITQRRAAMASGSVNIGPMRSSLTATVTATAAAANALTQPPTANYSRTFGPDLGIRYT
jgi:hypothetical protein